MHDFKKLIVWEKSVNLSVNLYNSTKEFPSEEKFGLISQIRRSSISIPSNIAEGAGRNHPKEFVNFLGISSGSCNELYTQLMIAQKVNFINEKDFENYIIQIEEIKKMIFKLKQSILVA